MKKQFLYFIFIITNLHVNAHSGNYMFRTYSPESGFYYDGIGSIQQDAKGFIWFTLENKVYRFDGYNFREYNSRFEKIPGGPHFFYKLEVSPQNQLFLSTDKGLYIYNESNDEFRYLYGADITNSGLMKSDGSNNLWITTPCLGILDIQAYTFQPIESENGLICNVGSICINNNDLFLGTDDGVVYYFDHVQKIFKIFFSFQEKYKIVNIQKRQNSIWILTESNGLYQIDAATATIDKIISFFCVQDNERVPAKTLHIDKDSYLWIATQRGLYVINPVDEHYYHYIHSESDPNSLPSSSVWSIMEDQQGNLWFGTYSGGLCYLDLNNKVYFKNYIQHIHGINHNVISGFAEDNRYLWITTEGGGINRMDKTTGNFSYYKHAINSLTYDNTKSPVLDHEGNLWVAMYRGGLDCLDTKRGYFKHYFTQKEKHKGPYRNDLKKILLEPNLGLWIFYQTDQLCISFYSFFQQIFSHIILDEDQDGKRNRISDMHRGENDDLWVISEKTLFRLNTKDYSIKRIKINEKIDVILKSLYVDKNNRVWIGTLGSGLIRYEIGNNEFTVLTDSSKYNSPAILSICEDNEDNLWLGTDNGLFKYDTKDNTFLRFDEKDGLHGNTFYPLSCMKGQNNLIYFGGTTGFTVFSPDDIVIKDFKPKTIITNFYLNNNEVKPNMGNSPLTDNITNTTKLTLNYQQTNFGFEFSSDNYLSPERTRFRYRLKNYDNKWIEVDASHRIASYAKVIPGNYTFEVQTSNNNGSWSGIPTTCIQISLISAPWKSRVAYILYIVICIAIIGVIIYYYNKQKSLKLNLHLENMEMTRKEEIHQERLQFFTNISHDLRTPLSLILAALENLKIESDYYYNLLKNNSKRLLNLVNELMDFRSAEDGKMELKLVFSAFNDFVYQIASDFHDYAEQHKIDFKIILDPHLSAPVYFDNRVIERIIMNLLNNAFQHTSQDGSITIKTYSDSDEFISSFRYSHVIGKINTTDSFGLLIRDTGTGIPSTSLSTVFNRYYRIASDNNQKHIGSGIGLSLVEKLVKLHQGAITIFSEESKGTDIFIVFSRHFDSNIKKTEEVPDSALRSYYVEKSLSTPNPEKDAIFLNTPDIGKFFHTRKHILIIEDNDDLRKVLIDRLSQLYIISEASDGMEASQLLEKEDIDLVVSDVMMPVKDGITLCKETKNNEQTSHIPFIILTAKGTEEDRLEGSESGADVYFQKPVNFDLLSSTIHNIFEHQQKLKEHYAQSFFIDHEDMNQHDKTFMISLIEIIEANIDNPLINVYQIASDLSMSRSKLYAKIKKITGKSIVEFIRTYKIQKAARLLMKGNLSIREIMDSIGFESQSHFTHSFKKEFRDTPTVFVSKMRKRM